jgi:dolichol-phosphate mannosyltransferase
MIDSPSIGSRALAVSVVVPVCNEADNVQPLCDEIHSALREFRDFEIIFVDDGSTDDTVARLRAARARLPKLRVLRHSARCGQSVALHTGIRAARHEWVLTLDGDGQNDPADIPKFFEALARDNGGEVKLIIGDRRRARQDSWVRLWSSRIANGVRRRLLNDGTPDTGCGIKLLHRPTFLQLPVFNHMHRFLPALYQREGARVLSVPVNHRPRVRGESKYGINNRLWVGIADLFAVRWLIRRAPRLVQVQEDGG